MTKKDVKTNLLNHSDAKVRLLGEYLKRYLSIISNDGFTEKINIYDLFCGQGLYDDGGEGSPIVTLRQVKETYYSLISKKPNKLPKINCHFNDIDQNKIEILRKSVKDKSLHYNDFGNLELTSNDYKQEVERLKNLIKTFKNQKGFIFIDPYGYKDIKSEHIKSLMDCNKKTEVLLWLPTQHMYRFAENGTPEALLDFIEELTQYKEWKKTDSVWKFINQIKDGFQSYVGNQYFVDNFSIQKEENTVFCLYFFTSHIKGFEKMLEAKWEIDSEQGRGWKYSGNVPDLFSENKTNELEDKLKIFLKESRKYNGDVYEFTLRQGYLPTHTKQIFEEWQKDNILDVILSNGEKARKKSFYIKYFKSTDQEIKKVYFSLK
jgi:three-Cys-motif partner protein